MKRLFVLFVIMFLLSGCAGKVTYTTPKGSYFVNNSITFNLSKDKLWMKIIPVLGSSFFVINNLDKESGFINVSYSGNPEKYIDCGFIESYVMNAAGERTYNFPASVAYKQYETFNKGQVFLFIERRMNLEGRINIVVQEIDTEHTQVSINTKYIVTKNSTGTTPQGLSKTMNDTISFNTNNSAVFPGGTTCLSTGILEKDLIALLKASIKKI